jgi:hypothetical protein
VVVVVVVIVAAVAVAIDCALLSYSKSRNGERGKACIPVFTKRRKNTSLK